MTIFTRLAIILLFYCALPATAQDRVLPLEKMKLPPGFSISLWAEAPNARGLALGKNGTVFAGSMAAGKVYAITESAGSRQVRVIANGLNLPMGVAFRDGALYISSVDRILRLDNIEQSIAQPPKPVVVIDTLPNEKHHAGRFISFGPDGLLYISVGAPCNSCEPDPANYALISRVKADGTGYEVYSQGVRNSLGFDWHPETKELWFTDTGHDWLGDNIPPDELNHAPRKGMHFGFPYCHSGDIHDIKYGAKRSCSKLTAPVAKLDAHSVPMGMRFYTGKMFPAEYHNQIIVAENGSWNRREKIGYRLKLIQIKNNKVVKQEVFVEGWLQEEKSWGKPADILVMPDGAILVSDDHSGAIYRISYQKP
jgi:glucose/arabinose dehydrogenase